MQLRKEYGDVETQEELKGVCWVLIWSNNIVYMYKILKENNTMVFYKMLLRSKYFRDSEHSWFFWKAPKDDFISQQNSISTGYWRQLMLPKDERQVDLCGLCKKNKPFLGITIFL